MFQDHKQVYAKDHGRGAVVLDEEMEFSVTIQNSGDADQVGVEVAVVARQWGLAFDRLWPLPGHWSASKCPAGKQQDLEWAAKPKCPKNCTGHGVCQFGRCFCTQGRSSLVGSTTVTVPAHSEVTVTIPHTFDSRAYTGLEFRVNGGMLVTPCGPNQVRCPQGFCANAIDMCKYNNGPKAPPSCPAASPVRCADGKCAASRSDCAAVEFLDMVDQASMLATDAPLGPESEAGLATDVGCVARSQTNGDVVHSSANASYRLPIVNDQDEEIAMKLSTRCRVSGEEEPGACSNVRVFAPGLDPATGVIIVPPNTELDAEIVGTEMEGTVEVEVFAQDVASGLVEVAALQFVVSDLEALINSPLLCCIRSIRVRVMLESLLVLLLLLVERGELERAMTVALKFIATVKQLLCDSFSFEEKQCLERAMLTILDTARMMAAQFGLDEELSRAPADSTQIRSRRLSRRHSIARAVREGDELRRQGMLEEAVVKYKKAPQAARRASLRNAGRAGTGRRVSVSNMMSTSAAAGNEEVLRNHPTQLFAHNVMQTETRLNDAYD